VQLTAAIEEPASGRAYDSLTAKAPVVTLCPALGAVGADVPHAAAPSANIPVIRIRPVQVIESSLWFVIGSQDHCCKDLSWQRRHMQDIVFITASFGVKSNACTN